MINFSKYHGLGNDFIIFNESQLIEKNITDYKTLAIDVCSRNTGIGADGMIVLSKSTVADFKMNFFNSDGSIAPMCGNGIRCFANYIFDEKLKDGDTYFIETLAGIMEIKISTKSGFLASVNMGSPKFSLKDIPMSLNSEDLNMDSFIDMELLIKREKFKVSSLFMGTTHSVIFVDDLNRINKEEIGRALESNTALYPVKTNVNFVEVISPERIKMVTFERGVGITLACGTGACASVVIGLKKNILNKKVVVELPLGELIIEVEESVVMTGPSKIIGKGIYFNKGEKHEKI